MKKLLLFTIFALLSGITFAQTSKPAPPAEQPKQRIALPAPEQPKKERNLFLILPEHSWLMIINMIRRSNYSSSDCDDIINYISANVRELPTAPTPAIKDSATAPESVPKSKPHH